MAAIDSVLANNSAYVTAFAGAELPGPPALKLALVVCMDARLDPAKALGLSEGDAHVIRNAGGVVTDDVIRSLAISQHKLGTREIMLLHHTRCGMQTFTDEEFAAAMEGEYGQRPEWPARAFAELEQDLRDSVRRIKDSPFVPHTDDVRAFIYEVETGRIREVV